MKVDNIIPNILVEGKIPEHILQSLDLFFSRNRGNFKTASEKFIAVRDQRVRMTPNADDSKIMSTVTPATFFRYRKGHRDMVEPETVSAPLASDNTTSDNTVNDIPVDDNLRPTEFKALDRNVASEHTIHEILRYYMRQFYNTVPFEEIAKGVLINHFTHTDETIEDIKKDLMAIKPSLPDSTRIDDETIIEKSIEHFGFKNDQELKQSLTADYEALHNQLTKGMTDKKLASQLRHIPMTKPHLQKMASQFYQPILSKYRGDIVKAYISRVAKDLKTATRKYQVVQYQYNKDYPST